MARFLKQQRYLNDTNYAESYARFRKENEKFGRFRVGQDLKVKGVHGDVIASAVGAVYGDTNEERLARGFCAASASLNRWARKPQREFFAPSPAPASAVALSLAF